ncbi:MAG: cytochrome C oxidase subunit IV family protein [Novosphingobium sp.]
MSGGSAPLLPVRAVWLILAGASIAGFVLAEGLAPPRIAASVAVLLAAFKIHLVFGQYMEVGWHHRPLRVLLQLWLFAVIAILLAGYWLA